VHADVGGGYLENEARLSDVALNWLLAEASLIPGGLKHDGSILRLSLNPAGPQHNEQAGGFLKVGARDLLVDPESGESKSPMHQSVYRRFEAGSVPLYDRMAAYRPNNMRFTSTSSTISMEARRRLPNASPTTLNRGGQMPATSGGSDLTQH